MGATHSTLAPGRPSARSFARVQTPSQSAVAAACPYGRGDNVILCGQALRHARQRGCVDVATVVEPRVDGPNGRPMMCLRLYAEDMADCHGGVGRPVEEVLVPNDGQGVARPLPVHEYDVPPEEIETRAAAFWAWVDALSKAADDVDPDRRLQAACACPLEKDARRVGRSKLERDTALSAITAHTPEGVTRFTTLVHDGYTERNLLHLEEEGEGERDRAAQIDAGVKPSQYNGTLLAAAGDANRCARPVIIATTGLTGGIARYGIAPMAPERTVQSAALRAYGLPLTPAYYQAVDWDRWPAYASLVKRAEARRAATTDRCGGISDGVVGVDSVWLYRLVTELVARGYRVAPGVNLAAACS